MIITGNEKPRELHWIVRYTDRKFEPIYRLIELKSEVVYESEEAAKSAADWLNAEQRNSPP